MQFRSRARSTRERRVEDGAAATARDVGAGLGLGCPGTWEEWTANGYDPTGKTSKVGDCFCDEQSGTCASGTISEYYKKCGCSDSR